MDNLPRETVCEILATIDADTLSSIVITSKYLAAVASDSIGCITSNRYRTISWSSLGRYVHLRQIGSMSEANIADVPNITVRLSSMADVEAVARSGVSSAVLLFDTIEWIPHFIAIRVSTHGLRSIVGLCLTYIRSNGVQYLLYDSADDPYRILVHSCYAPPDVFQLCQANELLAHSASTLNNLNLTKVLVEITDEMRELILMTPHRYSSCTLPYGAIPEQVFMCMWHRVQYEQEKYVRELVDSDSTCQLGLVDPATAIHNSTLSSEYKTILHKYDSLLAKMGVEPLYGYRLAPPATTYHARVLYSKITGKYIQEPTVERYLTYVCMPSRYMYLVMCEDYLIAVDRDERCLC